MPGKSISCDDREEFAKRLKCLIGDQSVRSFALKVGVSDTVVRQYLSGKSDPSRTILIAISRATNADISWLVMGEKGENTGGRRRDGQPQPLRTEALRDALETLEMSLKNKPVQLSPEKKVELILALYDYFSDSSEKKSSSVKLVSSIL